MENPVAKKDLVDTILELREEVEKRLRLTNIMWP
jgi:hypothetical protein